MFRSKGMLCAFDSSYTTSVSPILLGCNHVVVTRKTSSKTIKSSSYSCSIIVYIILLLLYV